MTSEPSTVGGASEAGEPLGSLLARGWLSQLFQRESNRKIMDFFIMRPGSWKKKDVIRVTGLGKSSVYRSLARLADLDLIVMEQDSVRWNTDNALATAMTSVVREANRFYLEKKAAGEPVDLQFD